MRNDDPKYLARIENVFVEKAHYQLPPNHQKILLYAIANVDPTKDEFEEIYLSVKDMELLLSIEGKPRRDYKYMNELFKRITNILISFDSEIEHNGIKLQGHFSLIQSFTPITINGKPYMEVLFSKKAKPFLLRLNQYVKINILEVAHMKSGHAIRLFQAFKAIRNKQRSHHKVSMIPYELNELKKLLGIEGKYLEFKRFSERVLKRAISEINTKTSIKIIEVKRIRNGRKIEKLIFHVTDQKTKDISLNLNFDGSISKPPIDSVEPVPLLEMKTEAEKKQASKLTAPTQADIDELTKAQWTAYYFLIDIHIYSSIAMEMVKGIKGTVVKGYEDVFIKYAWDNFLIRTTKYENIDEMDRQQQEARAGAFRQWWNQNCFNPDGQGLWSSIIEQIQSYKKSITTTEAYANRELAKGMSRNEFVKYYRAGGIVK